MTSGLWPDIRASLNGDFWVPAGTLITANGTAVPNGDGPGFPADIARALMVVADGMWVWRWIDYPAATFPMRPSIEILKQQLRQVIRDTAGPKVLSGYSQSAIGVGEVWREDILPEGGQLHDELDNIKAVILYGDPLRSPGMARGNVLAGQPIPKKLDGFVTGGIAGPNCLTPAETTKVVLSFANDGDLFASAPVGATPWVKETEVGHNETLIFEAVMEFDGHDIFSFATEVAQILTMPLTQALPLIQAIWNGLTFLGKGMNAPHWTYNVDAAVGHMITLGNKIREEQR